jgi:hypothetical protein
MQFQFHPVNFFVTSTLVVYLKIILEVIPTDEMSPHVTLSVIRSDWRDRLVKYDEELGIFPTPLPAESLLDLTFRNSHLNVSRKSLLFVSAVASEERCISFFNHNLFS